MIEIIRDDITRLEVDVIVNAANRFLAGGGGVDGAIHQAAGPELQLACREIGGCPTSEVRMTPAFNLKAKFILHTVGPIWQNGESQEAELLKLCYQNCLNWALDNKINTIAFPNISTGVYGFPKREAAQIAINTYNEIISETDDLHVIFCCFDQENYQIYLDLLDQ